MNIIQYLESSPGPTVSFEVLPPQRGRSMEDVFRLLDPLSTFNPVFISIANHQSGDQYTTDSFGRQVKCIPAKRPAWLSFSYGLRKRYKTGVLPHLLCNELTPLEMEDILIGLNYMGVHNVMALRGDRGPQQEVSIGGSTKYNYAAQVAAQVTNLNHGIYLDEALCGIKTNFCVVVAGYPEKHPEAKDLDTDIFYLKMKVNAGANGIITQMFYDNKIYSTYLEKCRAQGIGVPILPGLNPLYRKENLDIYRNMFHVSVPRDLIQNLQRTSAAKEGIAVGREWLLHQCRHLLANHSKHLHFFIFSPTAAEMVYEILNEVL